MSDVTNPAAAGSALSLPEAVKLMGELLARIRDRLPNPTPDRVATLYNSLAKDSVTDYGARVARLMEEKPWNRR